MILSLNGTANAAKSGWQDLGGGKARLLAVVDPATNALSGGIEIRLEEGWKTYWRYPGSSGIPPRFDFSASSGPVVTGVRFPAPMLLSDGENHYAGYRGTVVFPFRGTFAGAVDGHLQLDLTVGVCEEICIPARTTLSIANGALLQSDPVSDNLIRLAELEVPKTVRKELLIETMKMVDSDHLEIRIREDIGAKDAVLFVEGPESWYLVPPVPGQPIPSNRVFLLDVSRAPTGTDLESADLSFTLVADNIALQTK